MKNTTITHKFTDLMAVFKHGGKQDRGRAVKLD